MLPPPSHMTTPPAGTNRRCTTQQHVPFQIHRQISVSHHHPVVDTPHRLPVEEVGMHHHHHVASILLRGRRRLFVVGELCGVSRAPIQRECASTRGDILRVRDGYLTHAHHTKPEETDNATRGGGRGWGISTNAFVGQSIVIILPGKLSLDISSRSQTLTSFDDL